MSTKTAATIALALSLSLLGADRRTLARGFGGGFRGGMGGFGGYRGGEGGFGGFRGGDFGGYRGGMGMSSFNRTPSFSSAHSYDRFGSDYGVGTRSRSSESFEGA